MTSDRETCLNCARVYLAEAKNRRHSGNFYWVLMAWARNARIRANDLRDPQRGLF